MTEPINVTYSLETVLTRLETKIDGLANRLDERIDKLESRFDRLDEKVDNLTVDMAMVKTKLTTIEQQAGDNKKAIEKVSGDVADLKGFKALVIPLLVAIATAALTTLGRFIPAP